MKNVSIIPLLAVCAALITTTTVAAAGNSGMDMDSAKQKRLRTLKGKKATKGTKGGKGKKSNLPFCDEEAPSMAPTTLAPGTIQKGKGKKKKSKKSKKSKKTKGGKGKKKCRERDDALALSLSPSPTTVNRPSSAPSSVPVATTPTGPIVIGPDMGIGGAQGASYSVKSTYSSAKALNWDVVSTTSLLCLIIMIQNVHVKKPIILSHEMNE